MSAGSKSDLEIVYNLQWKHSSTYEKANIVGMYDIPATTLNWESFKSYVLKNSGATANDIKISYVSLNEKEFPIESQLDFQIAMYSFRQRARNGDIITLMLELINDRDILKKRNSSIRLERRSISRNSESFPDKSSPDDVKQDAPPNWFTKYMEGLKKEIVEEVTTSVVSQISTLKSENLGHSSFTYKKANKLGINAPIMIDKELTKALKLERRLDSKLEKLEQKSKKIREKKLALVDCTEDEALSNKSFINDSLKMGARSCKESKILHMSGGETYCHQWTVMNTGTLPWTSKTELCYAWGSASLIPTDKVISLPALQPGETDIVLTLLKVPSTPGHYESYWFFTHEKQRFGESLHINIAVDPPAVKERSVEIGLLKTIETDNASDNSSDSIIICTACKEVDESCNLNDLDPIESATTCTDIQVSDNHSIISIADSSSTEHSSNDEFVVITNIDCCESDQKPDVQVTNDEVDVESDKKLLQVCTGNPNPIEPPIETCVKSTKSDYAFVTINGEKHPVPKYLLRDDYLATAEDAPIPIKVQDELVVKESNCASNNDCDGNLSENIPLRRDSKNTIENTNVAPSIAESTECLPNTSCKGSIHSEVNDFSKGDFPPMRDFELNSSLNLNSSQISDSIDAVSQATNTSIKNGPSNYYYDYPREHFATLPIPNYVPLPNEHQPYYSRDNLTIEIPPPPPNGSDVRNGYFEGYPVGYSRSFQPYVSYSGMMKDYGQLIQQKKMTERQYWNENGVPLNRPTSRRSNHNLSSSLDMRNEKVMAANDLVTGAVDVASSAINTARSVLNMLNTSEQEKLDSKSLREKNLATLRDMGFINENINKTLLEHYENDLTKVIAELVL